MSKPTKLNLIIDNRETRLIDLIRTNTTIPEYDKLKSCEIEQLPVGDFHIIVPDAVTPLVIIERKTLTDFIGSISDGRYKEQLFRLKEYRDKLGARIMYIIEGETMEYQGGLVGINVADVRTLVRSEKRWKALQYSRISAEAIYSAFINIMIRDCIPIIESSCLTDTALLLVKILGQCEKKYSEIINVGNIAYCDIIKHNKRDNITAEVCYINQLAQIPGVSSTIAQAIAQQYPNWTTLFKAFEECEKPQMMLSKIDKIGKVLSQRIYSYLMPN